MHRFISLSGLDFGIEASSLHGLGIGTEVHATQS